MRTSSRRALLALVAGSIGCANVLAIDFDAYREPEGKEAGPPGRICVPNQTSLCLCELHQGIQTCDENGNLSPCSCSEDDDAGDTGSCGDGIVALGEACDDANTLSEDGCSAQCLPDGRPVEVESCPGQAITVWDVPLAVSVTGSVRGSGDAGACKPTTPPDRVYQLVPTESGSFELEVSSNVPVSFSLLSTCSTATPLSCDTTTPNTPLRRTLTLTVGQPLFLTFVPRDVSAALTYSFTLWKP